MERFNYYVEGRGLEWVIACGMLILSTELIFWPETLQARVFTLVLFVFSTKSISVILFVLGWAKCCGLMLNGQKVANVKLGPYIRAGSSVLSSVLFGQFTLALLKSSIDRGHPSVIMPFFFMFTFGELYVAYTTVKNARKAN